MASSDSLELTKTFFHAGIAAILYHRSLVKCDSHAFIYRNVAGLLKDGQAVAYKNFLENNTVAGGGVSQALLVLARGKDVRVDKLLDLLVSVYPPELVNADHRRTPVSISFAGAET